VSGGDLSGGERWMPVIRWVCTVVICALAAALILGEHP